MRWTVLTSDAVIFFSAALYFIAVYYNGRKDEDLVWAHAMVLLQPCAIIIDHGHFQVQWFETIFSPRFHFSLVIWYILLTSSSMDSLDKPTEKKGKNFGSLYKNNPHQGQKGAYYEKVVEECSLIKRARERSNANEDGVVLKIICTNLKDNRV
jgi:hypothetical protein